MSSFGEFFPSDGGGSHHTISSQYPNRDRPTQNQFSSSHEKKPVIPSFICHHPRSLGSSRNKAEKKATTTRNGASSSSSSQFKRPGSASERSNSKSLVSEDYYSRVGRPLMDEVAIGAVIGVLSGYIGRYLKDCFFRKTIRDKCHSVLERTSDEDSSSCDEVFEKMELGMEKVDMLVEDHQGRKKHGMAIKSLKNSIEILATVASSNAKESKDDASTRGVPNSHITACAHVYLAIAYKLLKNERVSSKHLLLVFCVSPYLARTYLIPDLWEHLFLPHLLHLKIWHNRELEFLSSEDHGEEKRNMKVLKRVYNEKMDSGTSLFALYYKQWLKVGATEPPLPAVPLPSITTCRSWRRRSWDSSISNSSINPNLYKAVFGPTLDRQLTGLGDQNGSLCLCEDEYNYCASSVQKEEITNLRRSISSSIQIDKHHSQSWHEPQKPDYFQCFSCRNIPTQNRSRNASIRKETTISLSTDLVEAIRTICSSDIIAECESAIRVVTRAWLRSPGDPVVEAALTKPSVIESILEVLSASSEDEILELIVSILSELVSRNKDSSIRQIILNSDPQLETFLKLLKSTSLFLKSAVLLFLSKPQAKQMLSSEWVPLVLRVLEFGDRVQRLFTVQCSPQAAALYLLDQLLSGFDEDRNSENARQVLSLGGLTLLLRRVEEGEAELDERNKAAFLIVCCVRAEGGCTGFVADSINKPSLLQLILLRTHLADHSTAGAFSLLVHLLCLDRRTKVLNFLKGLQDGWGGLNIMHILYVYLQKAPPEQCPLVAVILLLLDLMEDATVNSSSLYRREAIEALTASLNCETSNDGVQDQSARALHLLGSHFSDTGESLSQNSLLHKAGFTDYFCLQHSFLGNQIALHDSFHKDDEEVENWQKRATRVLFRSGNKNFLSALSDSMVSGIPSLSRASLITISWMSSYLHLVEDRNLPQLTLSILMPQLIQSLNYDRDVEDRVLASYSLLCLIKYSGCVSVLPSMDKESLRHLRNLSLVTWTANELISIFTFQSRQ